MDEWIWVARKPCGCTVAASVDDQNKTDLKRDLGGWTLRGLIITHEKGEVALGMCKEHLWQKYPPLTTLIT